MLDELPKELIQLIATFVFTKQDFASLGALACTNKHISAVITDEQWMKQHAPLFLWLRSPEAFKNLEKERVEMKTQHRQLFFASVETFKKNISELDKALLEDASQTDRSLKELYLAIQHKIKKTYHTRYTRENFDALLFLMSSIGGVMAYAYSLSQWLDCQNTKACVGAWLFSCGVGALHVLTYLAIPKPEHVAQTNIHVSAEAYRIGTIILSLGSAWVLSFFVGVIAQQTGIYLLNTDHHSYLNLLLTALFVLPLTVQVGCLMPVFPQGEYYLSLEKVLLSSVATPEQQAAWESFRKTTRTLQDASLNTVSTTAATFCHTVASRHHEKKEKSLLHLTIWGHLLQARELKTATPTDKNYLEKAAQRRRALGALQQFNHAVEVLKNRK